MSGLGPWGAQCVGLSMLEISVLKVGKEDTPPTSKKTHVFRVYVSKPKHREIIFSPNPFPIFPPIFNLHAISAHLKQYGVCDGRFSEIRVQIRASQIFSRVVCALVFFSRHA